MERLLIDTMVIWFDRICGRVGAPGLLRGEDDRGIGGIVEIVGESTQT